MLLNQTTEVLEWKKLLALLAGYTRSTRGAARVRSGVLSSDLAEARRLQQLTTEMAGVQNGPDPLPVMAFPDVEEAVGRAGKGAVLDTHELRDHAIVLALWDEVQRHLARHVQDTPTLVAAASALAADDELRGIRATLEAPFNRTDRSVIQRLRNCAGSHSMPTSSSKKSVIASNTSFIHSATKKLSRNATLQSGKAGMSSPSRPTCSGASPALSTMYLPAAPRSFWSLGSWSI